MDQAGYCVDLVLGGRGEREGSTVILFGRRGVATPVADCRWDVGKRHRGPPPGTLRLITRNWPSIFLAAADNHPAPLQARQCGAQQSNTARMNIDDETLMPNNLPPFDSSIPRAQLAREHSAKGQFPKALLTSNRCAPRERDWAN